MKDFFVRFGGIFIVLIYFSPAFSQTDASLIFQGTVLDSKGFAISGAKIKIFPAIGKPSSCVTDEPGKFICKIDFSGDFTLEIQAEGFSILRQNFTSPQNFPPIADFTLLPAGLREEIVVTAARTQTTFGETPASITALSKDEINTTAAPGVDDILRRTVGFSLFRRSSSRHANPTTQGTSLRGIGSSGASRSLVLFDGVPLNDAFGGWTYWSRVPGIAIERIEVLRGGASSLYGSSALSGTVNIIPRKIEEDLTFSAEIYSGTQKTFAGSAFFGFKRKSWSADFLAAAFQTGGYKIIEETERGLVDDFAGSKNTNFSGRLAKDFSERANVFFKASYFGEARNNGTPVQKNRTHFRQLAFGGNALLQNPKSKAQSPKLAWTIYGGTQGFDQTFSAVANDRNSENLVRLQRVPSQNFGFSSQFSSSLKNQTFLFGFEAKEVRGASDEIGFFNNNATSLTGSGGRERTLGAFFQDFIRIGKKIILVGNLRFDSWENFRALSSTKTLSNNQTATIVFPDRNENALSPQGSILFQATKEFSIYASASRSFRAPTLNELYRGFRVGNVVTLPNENLRAEKADNFETGVSFGKRKFHLRGNLFWTDVFKPISNVTLSASPNLITRQRQNAGKTETRGFEIEGETRFREFSFSVGYLFADSTVAEFPANQTLVGLRIPQVPRHQLTFQTLYAKKDWTLSFQGRAAGKQFDDDLNIFDLEPFFQLDAFAAKRFKEDLQVFLGVENLFNSRYSIGKTPVRSVSSPLNLRIGLRWR